MAGIQPFHKECRFHIAQRHRQQCHAAGFSKALNNAKRRRGKFGQGRHGACGHLQWKAVGVAKGAAGRVLEPAGQAQRELGLLGKQRLKAQAGDFGLVAGVGITQVGLELGLTSLELDGRRELGRHGRIELQLHGAQRQASGLGVFTLTAEAGRKRLTHLKIKPFFDRVHDATGRGHAFAKHQLQLGGGRQATVAGQSDDAQRRAFGRLSEPLRLQQRRAVSTVNQAHRHALAQAFGGAPHIRLHAGQCGVAIEAQGEKLFLVDAVVRVGLCALHKRPAGSELEASGAAEHSPFSGLQIWFDLCGASHARRQIAFELKRPLPLVDPAARARTGLRVRAAQAHRRWGFGVTKVHGGFVKLNHQLAHLRHLTLG